MKNKIEETIDWSQYQIEDFVAYSPLHENHQELTIFENGYFDKKENKVKFDFNEFIQFQKKLALAEKFEKELPSQSKQAQSKI